MSLSEVPTAFSRFGLGARPGGMRSLVDPQAALAEEISDRAALLLDDPSLPSTVEALTELWQFRQQRRSEHPKKAPGAPLAAAGASAVAMGGAGKPAPSNAMAVGNGAMMGAAEGGTRPPNKLMQVELAARLQRFREVHIGFGERLVAFWTNHFAVQANTSEVVRVLAGPFEREAIRPHVLGRFEDMLVAVAKHPAMLTSLTNASSIGPDSRIGMRRGKGLNENLGREMMELHTIGVDAGYTQADVTSYSRVLTGWTFGQNPGQPRTFGRFVFRDAAHEPGPQTIMGKVYAQTGMAQALAVMHDLANNPATARHIALKFARHFVADTPDAGLVDRLARVFETTRGNLHALSLALINDEAAWNAPASKLRTPQEFIWASLRALDLRVKPEQVVRALSDLGEPLWTPPSPQGFKDDTAAWLAPDAMVNRLDLAELMAERADRFTDPRQLAVDILGPGLSLDTRTSIDRAESRTQAFALMLMSPEFQRR